MNKNRHGKCARQRAEILLKHWEEANIGWATGNDIATSIGWGADLTKNLLVSMRDDCYLISRIVPVTRPTFNANIVQYNVYRTAATRKISNYLLYGGGLRQGVITQEEI